jgi:hypothetical protein
VVSNDYSTFIFMVKHPFIFLDFANYLKLLVEVRMLHPIDISYLPLRIKEFRTFLDYFKCR